MLVAPLGELKRLKRIEHEKHQNKVIEGLLNNFDEEKVEGDNLTIDNCAIAPLKEFKICGKDIKQATETENLIDNEWEQGSLHITSGLIENSTNRVRTKNYISVIPGHMYKISRTIYNKECGFRYYDKDFNYLGSHMTAGLTSANTMAIGESSIELTILDENVAYMKIVDVSNDLSTIYTMTTEAINIDYPSPLEYVEGNQDVKHINENLIDVPKFAMDYPYNNVTYVEIKYENGIILEYNKTNRIIHFHTSKKIEKNKKYYLKCNYTVLEGNETTKVVGGLLKVSQYVNINSVFTASEDTDTVSLYIDLNQWLEGTKVAITDIMFCESDVAPKKYIEHKSEIYPLDLTNRNLLPYPYTETSKKMNGIVWIDNKDGSITAKGIATQDSSFKLYGELSNQKIIKGKYLSGGKNSNEIIRIVTRQDNNYIILANCVGSSAAINLDAYQEGYIEIVIKAGTEVDTTFYPMISAFNTDVYEKYTESYEYNLYSKNDYIYYDEKLKKYFVHNEYDKKIIDGVNIQAKYHSLGNLVNTAYINNLLNKILIPENNNIIIDISSDRFYKSSVNSIINNKLSSKIAVRVDGVIFFSFGEDSELTTTELINEWFQENPTEILYPLAVPAEKEITSKILIEQLDKLRKIMSHKDTNHFIVTSENGQSVNLKAIVYKDTFKILKEEIDNLKALILES